MLEEFSPSEKRKNLIVLGTPLVLLILFSLFLQITVVGNQEKISAWLVSFGPWFILIYALLQTTTIIVAPLGGGFIWLAMIAVIGPFKGVILGYLVSTPAFFVNFFLARKYGRNLVKKMVGQEAFGKIDRIAADFGIPALIVFKIFQGGYFDFVSYAAGLTKIPFRVFFFVNILGGIPGSLIVYLIFSKITNFTFSVIALYIFVVLTFFTAFYLLTKRFKNRHLSSDTEK